MQNGNYQNNTQQQNRKPQQSNEPSDTIFVGNIAFTANEQELGEFFEECGSILKVQILMNKSTFSEPHPKSRGYGFIKFASVAEAEKAVETMDQKNYEK